MGNRLDRIQEMKDLTERIAKSVLRQASTVRSELHGRALQALDRVLLGLEKPKRFVKKARIRPPSIKSPIKARIRSLGRKKKTKNS